MAMAPTNSDSNYMSDKKVWERFGGLWSSRLDMSKIFFLKKKRKTKTVDKPWTNRGKTY